MYSITLNCSITRNTVPFFATLWPFVGHFYQFLAIWPIFASLSTVGIFFAVKLSLSFFPFTCSNFGAFVPISVEFWARCARFSLPFL